MTAIMREPYAGVSFAKSKARPERQPSEVAQALGLVLRLAEARSAAWCRRQPTRHLTAALDQAWSDLRAARALLTPHEPPAEHRRVEGVLTVQDRRYVGAENAVARFLIDRCVSDSGGRVSLAAFADELREYVSDPAERADLPTSRQLAGLLRDRGITVARVGGVIYAQGVRLLSQDESCHMPEATSD